MPVGQEHGLHPVEASSDAGEETLYAPAREPGVHEQAASVRLYVGRVARATAREYAQPQGLPFSFVAESECKVTGDLSTSSAATGYRRDPAQPHSRRMLIVGDRERHNPFLEANDTQV